MADDLNSDRKMPAIECHADRGGGLAGLIEHRGEQRVLERLLARNARLFGREIHHRQRRRDDIVPAFEGSEQRRLHLADLPKRPIEVGAGMPRATKAPFAHIRVDIAFAVRVRRKRTVFEITAHLEEQVDRGIGVVIERRDERLDDGAGAGQQSSGNLDRVAHFCRGPGSKAHVGEDADLQSLDVPTEPFVISHAIRRKAPGVTFVLSGQYRQQAGDIVDAAPHRSGHAHGIGRKMRHAPVGGLQRRQSAMGGRQPNRAGDVRSDRNESGTRGDRGAGAC